MTTLWTDLDGTIADLFTPWIAWANERYGTAVRPEDVTTYRLQDVFPPKVGGRIFSYLRGVGVYTDLEPYPGAVEALDAIATRDDVIIRGMSVVPWNDVRILKEKIQWLHERFKGVHGPHPAQTDGEKARFIEDGDIVIDDCPETLLACRQRTDQVLVIDRPYNQGLPNIQRVSDWDAARIVIQQWLS